MLGLTLKSKSGDQPFNSKTAVTLTASAMKQAAPKVQSPKQSQLNTDYQDPSDSSLSNFAAIR